MTRYHGYMALQTFPDNIMPTWHITCSKMDWKCIIFHRTFNTPGRAAAEVTATPSTRSHRDVFIILIIIIVRRGQNLIPTTVKYRWRVKGIHWHSDGKRAEESTVTLSVSRLYSSSHTVSVCRSYIYVSEQKKHSHYTQTLIKLPAHI